MELQNIFWWKQSYNMNQLNTLVNNNNLSGGEAL